MGKAVYKDLIVWQKSDQLAKLIYLESKSFPKEEYLVDFTFELRYFSKNQYESVQRIREEVGRLLWKFYESV